MPETSALAPRTSTSPMIGHLGARARREDRRETRRRRGCACDRRQRRFAVGLGQSRGGAVEIAARGRVARRPAAAAGSICSSWWIGEAARRSRKPGSSSPSSTGERPETTGSPGVLDQQPTHPTAPAAAAGRRRRGSGLKRRLLRDRRATRVRRRALRPATGRQHFAAIAVAPSRRSTGSATLRLSAMPSSARLTIECQVPALRRAACRDSRRRSAGPRRASCRHRAGGGIRRRRVPRRADAGSREQPIGDVGRRAPEIARAGQPPFGSKGIRRGRCCSLNGAAPPSTRNTTGASRPLAACTVMMRTSSRVWSISRLISGPALSSVARKDFEPGQAGALLRPGRSSGTRRGCRRLRGRAARSSSRGRRRGRERRHRTRTTGLNAASLAQRVERVDDRRDSAVVGLPRAAQRPAERATPAPRPARVRTACPR